MMDCVAIFLTFVWSLVFTHVNGLIQDIHRIDEKPNPIYKSAASEFSSHEVVQPIIIQRGQTIASTLTKDGHHRDVVIKLQGPVTTFTLNLQRNENLLSKQYVEKNFKENNKYSLKRPHFKKLQRHCHYHGNVEGLPFSQVAVSTCRGISGYIHDGMEGYHIEPAFDLNKTAHRLYRDRHSLLPNATCGTPTHEWPIINNISRQMAHKNEIFHRMRRSVKMPYDANINSRYVEMYVVNDFKTYESYGRDERRLIYGTQIIINIVSRLYHPFNIYVVLVGIESWIDGSPRFVIHSKADKTLENFLHYRKSRINAQHPNDNAQLVTGSTFSDGVVGKAMKGTICTYQYSGGVSMNLATPGQTATTIAHELGHNFGMDHDNYTICQCKEDKCIMAATSGGSEDMRMNTPSHWSSCSMLALQEAFEMGMDYCLQNQPQMIPEGPMCGNGFKEDGEECDCGQPQDCQNHCCNATTCKLTPGSSCATGACCDLGSCKPKAAATLCRSSVSECDLPEFCWGDKPDCPADVFLQDGIDCGGGQAYCYKGQCNTYSGQCKLLWGSTGRVSDPICFEKLNTNGSKHGNCGYNWTTDRYESCLRDDVMCGLLHCVHQNEKLMFWKDSLTHATPATFLTMGTSTYICRGAMLDVGLDMPDPGMVPDGAKCSHNKICVQHKCTPLSYLSIPTCPEGCSGQGVCNSRGNCHCEEHYGPPICDGSGYGGSIDSGPISLEEDKSTMVGLLVFFLVVLPLVGIAVFLAYRYRDRLRTIIRTYMPKARGSPSRPAHPVRPPPKREGATGLPNQPAYQNQPPNPPASIVVNNNRPTKPVSAGRNGPGVNISGPVFLDSTHKDTKSQPQRSPAAVHKQPRPSVPPKKPESAAAMTPPNQHKPLPVPPAKPGANSQSKPNDSKATDKPSNTEGKSDLKSKFGPMFKIPSFNLGDRQSSPSPKVESKRKEEEMPTIVKRRELTREISNPVLISTTDRRSKHLVKLETLQVKQPASDESTTQAPLLPPKVSLNRSDSDNRHRNRPLPPRPLSMPESECGDEEDFHVPRDNRKSLVCPPQRPNAPPAVKRPSMDQVRLNLEEELAKIDSIQIKVFDDNKHTDSDQDSEQPAKTDIKPKPRMVSKPSSGADGSKKPMVPSKSSFGAADRPGNNTPTFNSRTGLNKQKPSNTPPSSRLTKDSTMSDSSGFGGRKVSTDSLDEDTGTGSASVAGLAKRFTDQQKPLLTGNKPVSKTRSNEEGKAPMTPPKPRSGVKKVRSVHV